MNRKEDASRGVAFAVVGSGDDGAGASQLLRLPLRTSLPTVAFTPASMPALALVLV